MKGCFLPRLALLTFCAIVIFTGCDSTIDFMAETAALNTGRSSVGDIEMATITGPLTLIDGTFAVLYQGNLWYIKGESSLGFDLTEGETVTITGKATPILDRDGEGNSLFFGYSLHIF